MHDAVTVHMAASPERIWSLISDVTNTGRFSPETFAAEWLDGATAPAVGVRFRGHVKRNGRGPTYWTTCTVTVCDPGREFTFAVRGPGGKAVNTWSYRIEPQDAGADVTESFQLADTAVLRLYWAVAGRARSRTNVSGMRTTLERIKAVAEAPDDSPG
jgi:hypothetical protein